MAAGGFFKYLKKAFLFHWNLLALGAGAVIGVVSGRPDIVLPVVAAGEVAFLAGLATHQRFQAAVDAEEHKAKVAGQTKLAAEKARQLLESLSPDDQERFHRLRAMCLHLREIALGMKGETAVAPDGLSDMQSGGINRLLWIYLKLLFSKGALERFFETIDQDEIQRDLDTTRRKLDSLGPPEKDNDTARKKRKSLEDHFATSQQRMDNYYKARENFDLIQVDLERMYAKIASLGEMGINRQDPNYITNEVDSVSASVQQTEKAMGELQFLSTLSTQDDTPPALLDVEEKRETIEL